MANEPTPKLQEQPATEKQTVEKQPIEQLTGNKATTVKPMLIKLRVTAGKGAQELVAGIHFPEGKTKTMTVTPERAAIIQRAAGLTVEEIK